MHPSPHGWPRVRRRETLPIGGLLNSTRGPRCPALEVAQSQCRAPGVGCDDNNLMCELTVWSGGMCAASTSSHPLILSSSLAYQAQALGLMQAHFVCYRFDCTPLHSLAFVRALQPPNHTATRSTSILGIPPLQARAPLIRPAADMLRSPSGLKKARNHGLAR